MERGQDYVVEIGGTRVGKLTSASLSRERDLIETNNFDSPDHAESIVGMASAELEMEALYVYDDAGQAAVEAAFADRSTPAAVVLTSADDTAGVFEFSGNLWITSLELSFETNEVVTYSISGTFTGQLARTQIT